MSLYGMDTSHIRSVAQTLGRQSGELERLISAAEGLVQEALSVWEGNDARQFKEWWETEHKPSLLAAQALLERFSDVASAGVTAQENASRA